MRHWPHLMPPEAGTAYSLAGAIATVLAAGIAVVFGILLLEETAMSRRGAYVDLPPKYASHGCIGAGLVAFALVLATPSVPRGCHAIAFNLAMLSLVVAILGLAALLWWTYSVFSDLVQSDAIDRVEQQTDSD